MYYIIFIPVYLLSALLWWTSVRYYHIRDKTDTNLFEAIVTFIPVVNTIWGIMHFPYNRFFEGTNYTNKFFNIKK